MKPESEPLDDPFGWRAHDKQVPEHSGLNGHYCNEFDGLWICQDCSEWDCCTCFGEAKEIAERSKPRPGDRVEWIQVEINPTPHGVFIEDKDE